MTRTEKENMNNSCSEQKNEKIQCELLAGDDLNMMIVVVELRRQADIRNIQEGRKRQKKSSSVTPQSGDKFRFENRGAFLRLFNSKRRARSFILFSMNRRNPINHVISKHVYFIIQGRLQ